MSNNDIKDLGRIHSELNSLKSTLEVSDLTNSLKLLFL